MDPDDSQLGFSNRPPKKDTAGREMALGEKFGNFRVVKCLTVGLIASYYQMQHLRDLHDVTIGVFHPRTVEDPKFLKRLRSLQKTLEGFDQTGIPKILDAILLNDQHCIFLEPVHGQSLSDYFDSRRGPNCDGLESAEVTQLMAELLGVLGYAHSKGVDHRDLDTDLIYVNEDGALQILGLGIKLTLGVDLFESIVSASISPLVAQRSVGRLNSFDVMSPEYKAGIPETLSVDVYGAGVVGYWLLTGHKAQLAQFVEPSSLGSGVSKDWDVYFRTALEREVEPRYGSCKAALLGLQDTVVIVDSESAGSVQRQIDRIRVPKRIAEKGDLATRVYRLCIIGIVGLTLTALAAAYLKSAFTEPTDVEREVAKKVYSAEEANLFVSVNPPVVKVQVVGHEENFISKDGLLQLALLAGQYELRFSAPNCMEQKVSILISSNKNEATDLSIDLEPAWSDFKITSEPGAAVSVVSDQGLEYDLGLTDLDGVLFAEKAFPAGVYHISMQKEGYGPCIVVSHEIAAGQVAELEVELVPLRSSLTIKTEPAGARILIDDIEVGVSPLSLDDLSPRKNGLVVVRLNGYRSQDRRVDLQGGESATVDFGELMRRSGSLKVEVSFAGAVDSALSQLKNELSVNIDGRVIPYGDGLFDEIEEGMHQIRLIHPLYLAEQNEVTVADGQAVQIGVVLSPRSGVVEVVVLAELDVSARMNGVPVELLDGLVGIPADQEVELQLIIQDHMTMNLSLKLMPGERYVWQVNPMLIPSPEKGQPWTVPYLGCEFVWLGPGRFIMGGPLREVGRLPNEGPTTSVQFTQGFWMAAYEVTQKRFIAMMGWNPSEFIGLDKPVDRVTWADAKLFCESLTESEEQAGRLPSGFVYRLPTEAEWEYGARAGSTGPFSFGDKADASMGNFRGVYPQSHYFKRQSTRHYGTKPVGSYKPNGLGLYDVHGNVEEWTLDFYNGRLPGSGLVDPQPRADGLWIAVRGGSWEDFATATRSAVRGEIRPETLSSSVGFRVVLAPVK